MEKRVYRESPLKVAVIVVAGVIGFMLFALFLFTYVFPSAPSTPSENMGGIIGFGSAIGIMLLTLLILWLTIKKRAITVDLTGCEVVLKRPFGQPETERFLWKDVSAVNIRSQSYTIRNSTQTNYVFSVIADGQAIYLMDKTFLTQNLKGLVADVSAATKHLLYAWEECRPNETRPILETAAPFCKISLDPNAVRVVNQNVYQNTNPGIGPVLLTKKQTIQNAQVLLITTLILTAITLAFVGWDYHEQKKRWEYNARIPSIDFNTGKTIEKPPPPPMKYVLGDSGLMPFIVICGLVSLGTFVLGIYVFSSSRRMIETPEMFAADAERETIENSPEVKRIVRTNLILWLSTPIVSIPVPFMAVYKVHYVIVFGYIFFVAAVVGILYFVLPRRI